MNGFGCLVVAAGGNSLAAMIMQVMVAGDKTKEDHMQICEEPAR